MAVLGSRILLLGYCCLRVSAFSSVFVPSQRISSQRFQSTAAAAVKENKDIDDRILDCSVADNNSAADRLKREIFQLGAAYDRGFGASPRARQKTLAVIEKLEECNTETNAARYIQGASSPFDDNGVTATSSSSVSPLTGNWRMVWTTALDVLLLQASPIFTTGAIHQVFQPPLVTNVIDFLPRFQALLPPDLIPNSLIRAKVQTAATERSGKPNRVGLIFERVEVAPLQVLGVDIEVFPPIGFNLPKLPGTDQQAVDSPGYFDVTYLDEELLVIRQNAPGGIFVLVKVDSIEA